jgi:hypothetical protein
VSLPPSQFRRDLEGTLKIEHQDVCLVARQIVDIAMSFPGDGQIRVVPLQTHSQSTAANDLRYISVTATSAATDI